MAGLDDEAPQEPNGKPPNLRQGDDPWAPEGGQVVPGRRRSDYDLKLTISRKAVVVTVVIIDALYLVGQALVLGQGHCL